MRYEKWYRVTKTDPHQREKDDGNHVLEFLGYRDVQTVVSWLVAKFSASSVFARKLLTMTRPAKKPPKIAFTPVQVA